MIESSCVLEASRYEDLAKNRKVISSEAIESMMYVHMASDLVCNKNIYDIREIGVSEKIDNFDLSLTMKHDRVEWVDIESQWLNLKPGVHTYKIGLISPKNDMTSSLYFGYTIINNNPDKPYIYMNRKEAEA